MTHLWLAAIKHSCFEKGCLTKALKVNATMSKVIMGNDGFALDYWNPRYFGVREGSSTNTCIHAFSLRQVKHREPKSAKLLLPIIPIGIVGYAFVLFWDNLKNNTIWWAKGRSKTGFTVNDWTSSKTLRKLERISLWTLIRVTHGK